MAISNAPSAREIASAPVALRNDTMGKLCSDPFQIGRLHLANFTGTSFQDALSILRDFSLDSQTRHCVSLNAYSLYWACRSSEFRRSLEEASLVIADGASIVLAGRLLGFPVKERVAGFDIMLALLDFANSRKLTVGLVGAQRDILSRLKSRWRFIYPNICLKTVLEEVQGARLVFVALPQPEQEIWIVRHKDKLRANLIMGVGGAFEVLAGEAKRAPLLWQRIGLEWLYRFLKQPRRRWKKTLISTVWFGLYLTKAFFIQLTQGRGRALSRSKSPARLNPSRTI